MNLRWYFIVVIATNSVIGLNDTVFVNRMLTTNAANSKISTTANTSSYLIEATQTMSVINTSLVTHITVSSVVNITSLVRSPYSPAIFSIMHSSSKVATGITPEKVPVRITIDANCSQVPAYQLNNFKDAVRLACSKVLNISASKINIFAVTCWSITVDMKIENVRNENITQKLTDAVDKKQLNISYNGTQLVVTSVKKLPAVRMASTVVATASISINSLSNHLMSSNNGVSKTLSGSLPSSSLLTINMSVSATAYIITTNATNSVVSNIANMSLSNTTAVMPTMSVVNTTFETHVRTLPVVNMTSLVKSISYSIATSSIIHLSSTTVVTPVTPEIVLARIIIDANCSQVPAYQSTDFKDAIRLACSKVLNISTTKINISAVTCGSIIVDMQIENVNNENITQKLADAVDKKQLNISYNGTQLVVTSVKKLPALLMTSTVAATSSISINSLSSHFLSSNNGVSKTLSGSLPSSSMLSVNKSVSATASTTTTNATNSMVSITVNVSLSNMSPVMPTISVANTTFATHVRTSPAVSSTKLLKSPSYSPTAFSMTPLSSTTVVTPVTPEIVLARIAIDANCSQVPSYQSTEFKNAVRSACGEVLNITASSINVFAVTCGSIVADISIKNVKNENIFQKLEDAVRKKQLNISYNGTQFAVISVSRLTTIPATATVAPTTLISKNSLTSNFVSSINGVSKTSGSLPSKTISQVLSNSSMWPVSESVVVKTSIMTTSAIKSTVAATVNMFSHSFAVNQTMSVINATFVTEATTSPVINMTSSVERLSYFPTISPLAYSSSSQVVTPITPEIVLVRITIDANCSQVPTHQSTDFKDAVRLACVKVLNISASRIDISAVICGSIIVDIKIENVNNENVTQKLSDAVDEKELNISYNGTQFPVTSVKKLTTITETSSISSPSPIVMMTNSMERLSYSPTMTSLAHSSSSQVVTPFTPEIVLVRLTIDANCSQVPTYSSISFKNAVRLACSKVLGISTSRITISAVNCGSIIVDMKIEDVNKEKIFQKLQEAVDKNQLNVTYNGTQLAVTSVKQISTKEPNDGNDDNTALIIYIVFGSVLGLAFLIGIVGLVVRCRHERSNGMFHLPSKENLELSGFSGPNKSYRGGNFYGESQPPTNDEEGFVNNPDSTANDPTGDTENGESVGAGYLPAWKNLPTMDMSEVSHEDNPNQVNDNLLLMYGKTSTDEGNDSGKTNFVASFDNIGAV